MTHVKYNGPERVFVYKFSIIKLCLGNKITRLLAISRFFCYTANWNWYITPFSK